MTVILGGAKWHADLLHFSGNAGGAANLFTVQSYFPGRFTYGFNDVQGAINLRSIAVTQSWATFSEGSTRVVYGTGLTTDSAQNLTGGTVQVLSTFPAGGGPGLSLIGISVAVSVLSAASASAGGRDDARLIASMLSGNDLAGLSNKVDVFDAHGGTDLIFANRGNDKITLGDGMDCGLGGAGNDSLLGEAGDDLLIGNQGNDRLVGGIGLDMLDGGRGGDSMVGGAGGDVFVFRPGDGADRLSGFDAAEDIISFGVPGGLASDARLRTAGADAVLTYHDNVIRLVGQAGLTLEDIDIRFGLNTAEARLETFVNFFDFKG